MSSVRKRPAATSLPLCKRPALALEDKRPALAREDDPPEWFGEVNLVAQNEVFLVTAAKLLNDQDDAEDIEDQRPPPLKDPAALSKGEFRKALEDSIANPLYQHKRGGRNATHTPELEFYMGVKEGKPGEQHHHAAIKLFAKHRFLPFKLAMRWRWGIATHWSTSHTQLWSVVRYLHCTTEHKSTVDTKPELWTRDGRKVNLYEESQEPFQAKALRPRVSAGSNSKHMFFGRTMRDFCIHMFIRVSGFAAVFLE